MKHQLGLFLLVAGAGFLLLKSPSAMALGTTVTWNGTDCLGSSHNCTWSDANNWVGSAAPTAGDNLVFNNSSLSADEIVTDNIASSTVFGDLTFSGSTPYAFLVVPYNDNANETDSVLAINGDVTDSIVSGSNASVSGIYGSFTNAAPTPTYTMDDSFQFGLGPTGDQLFNSPAPSVALASTAQFSTNTAVFTGSSAATDVINYAAVTGTGGDTIDLNLTANGDFQQLAASPSYAGILRVLSGTLDLSPYLSPAILPDMFSGAQLNILSGAGLVVQDPSATSTTFAEPIIIGGTGTQNCSNAGTSTDCGAIFADIDPSSILTLSGAITLSENTQINTTGQVTIAGILTGNYSIATPYVGSLVVSATTNTSQTPNGTYSSNPPASTTPTSSTGTTPVAVPGTPNTGLASIHANPLLTLIGSSICAVSLLLMNEVTKATPRKVRAKLYA